MVREFVSGKNVAGVVRQIMEEEKVNQTELAKMMGCMRQSINQAINRTENMRYDSFYKIIDVLGYEIILRKKCVFEK